MVDIAAAVKRYVPGAEALVPSSSSTSSSSTSKTKNKKKTDKKAGSSTPAGGKAESVAATTTAGTTTTTTDDKPVALLSQAPSADDLPRELVADPREVEKELAKDQDREQQQQQLERKKGPAEEMVFKRIKLLNKKIQRFEGYQAKDESQLNPDQKAAIASLPVLKGGLKELEDVQKALEAVEVETARERRSLVDGHASEIEAAKRQAVESYKATIFPTISQLISTYSALHPQAPAASFMPPDLPAHLQDISSADVRRVDELFERVRDGKDVESALDEAEVTLKHLSAAKRIDPQNAASADVNADAPNFSPPPLDSQSLQKDVSAASMLTFDGSAADEVTPSAIEVHEAFRHEPEVAEQPLPATVDEAPPAGPPSDGTVSFMQSSEIRDAPQVQEAAASAPTLAEPVAPVPAAIEAVQVNQPVFGTETPKFDWADDDDHDGVHDLNAIRAQLNIPAEAQAPASAVEPSTEPVEAARGQAPSAARAARGPGGGAGRGKSGARNGRGGPSGGQGERPARQEGGAGGAGRGQRQGPPRQNANGNGQGRLPVLPPGGVDEDGFTVISKRQPSFQQHQQQRQQGQNMFGRGRGGGAGRGGQRGGARTPSRGGLANQA